MKRCAESARIDRIARIQDFLDELLSPGESAAFRSHLAECSDCADEVMAYARLFHAIERVPSSDPGPRFTERVLMAVLPSRVRRRWLRAAGWTYAGSLAASAAAAMVVARLPETHAWLDVASVTASRHTVQLVVFVLNILGFATLGIANGWGAVASFVARVAPLPRALVSVLQQPTVEMALWAAAVICVALLWLLHGRDRSSSGRVDPLGMMGV